jgi:predicted regulator of Ras-like GTPase activity (Roadblock/LC7/MglB family)
MTAGTYQDALDRMTRVSGVRGAVFVNAEDGVVVADAVLRGVRANAVAALAASLMRHAGIVVDAVAAQDLRFLHLQADDGALIAVPAGPDLLIAVVGGPDLNVGLARLEMLRAAEALA